MIRTKHFKEGGYLKYETNLIEREGGEVGVKVIENKAPFGISFDFTYNKKKNKYVIREIKKAEAISNNNSKKHLDMSPAMLVGITTLFPESRQHDHFKNGIIELTCKECARYFGFKVE